jgi:hypothetical protein
VPVTVCDMLGQAEPSTFLRPERSHHLQFQSVRVDCVRQSTLGHFNAGEELALRRGSFEGRREKEPILPLQS